MFTYQKMELNRLVRSQSTWIFFATGLVLVILTESSFIEMVGVADDSSVADNFARYWMVMHLPVSWIGALYIGNQFSDGTVYRNILLLGGSRRRFFLKSLLIVFLFAIGSAVVIASLSLLSPYCVMGALGRPVPSDTNILKICVGIFVSVVLAALWGFGVGLIFRKSLPALLFLLLQAMALEPYLPQIVPNVAKYTLTILFGSLYLDGKPYQIGQISAALFAGVWVCGALALGYYTLRNRDLP